MRRLALVVAILLLLLSLPAGFAPALAQDGPPADPAVGTTVPFIGPDGGEAARFTVEEVADPFDGYDASYPPERGTRYVLVRVAIENAGTRPLPIDPSGFAVQDADGFLAFPASISLLPEAEARTPLLGYGELAGGGATVGALAFQVFNGVEPIRVVYQPSRDRLVILADLRAGAGGAGTEAPAAAPAQAEIPPTPAPVSPALPGADIPTPEPPAAGIAPPAADPAAADAFAVLLVANNCPPGTPLPDIQVTPCPQVGEGFDVTLAGVDRAWTAADLATRGARQAWTGVPAGDYTLSFAALPDGHDAYYVFGGGTEPAVRVLGEPGVPVRIGPAAAPPGGPIELQVFFVDAG